MCGVLTIYASSSHYVFPSLSAGLFLRLAFSFVSESCISKAIIFLLLLRRHLIFVYSVSHENNSNWEVNCPQWTIQLIGNYLNTSNCVLIRLYYLQKVYNLFSLIKKTTNFLSLETFIKYSIHSLKISLYVVIVYMKSDFISHWFNQRTEKRLEACSGHLHKDFM